MLPPPLSDAPTRLAAPARRVPWTVAGPAVAAAGLALMALAGVRVNLTASLARGLYLVTAFDPGSAERGQLVTLCPPRETVGRVEPYLLAGDDCAGGDGRAAYAELGKALAALPGDTVTVGPDGVRVGGRLLEGSAPVAHSRRGAPVEAALGTHVLGPGEYWAHSGRVRYSLDSRYYGPVRDVRAALRPLLVGGGRGPLESGGRPLTRAHR